MWETIFKINNKFRDVATKLGQYKELETNDGIKDYLTSNNNEFVELGKKIIAAGFNLACQKATITPFGCAMLASEDKKDNWMNSKKHIYYVLFYRSTDVIEDTVVRKVSDELKSKGYLLAIASTTQGKNMAIYRHKNKNIISKANIDDYFDVVYSRDDCYEIKPHPEVFCKVLSTLNVSASDALVFEDSLVGVEASKRAGIECCAVYDEYSDHDREKINALADHTINSFLDLF